jgi:hypothetical protein
VSWTTLALSAALAASSYVAPIAAADEISATAPSASAEQIAALIRQLGSDRFSAREAASDQLAQIGLPAFGALEEASRSRDREVRYRAERILTLIRRNDLERRLAAFVARTGKADDQLPAWSRFRAAHGDTTLSRQLFVEMQRAEPELLAALDNNPRDAVELLGRRLAERQAGQLRPGSAALAIPPAELCAHLFVAGEPDAPLSSISLALIFGQCRQLSLSPREAAGTEDLVRRMLGRAIARTDARAAATAFALAVQFDLKEGLVPAVKLLEEPTAPANQSGQLAALNYIARMGDESHLGAVERLLENATVLQKVRLGGVEREWQLRDAALATLVLLTRQDTKEYFKAPTGVNVQQFSLSVLSAGFDNDEQRQAAISKWKDFASKRPKARAPAKDQPAAPAPQPKMP